MAIKDFGMKTIHSFLQERVYFIPDYQREYSWELDQLDDLWEDLTNTNKSNRSHFFGQVVIHEAANGSCYIIDGQQRTSTSVILLAVFRDFFSRLKINSEDAKSIEEDIRIKYIGRWTSRRDELRLHLGVADKEYFKENIQKKRPIEPGETISQKRIYKAYMYFEKQIQGLLKGHDDEEEQVNILIDLYEALINKFTLMSLTTDDINEAFIIFETLNARGKDLETSDLLKNFVFMQAGSNIDSIKDKWLKMIDTLDKKEDATKFIRYYWNSGHDFVREKNLYKEISSEIKPTKCEEFVSELLDMADLYNGLISPADNKCYSDNGITDALINLSIMKTATFYPIMFAMNKAKYSLEDIKKVVKSIEVLAFRNFVVAGLTANKYETFFAAVAKKISMGAALADEVVKSIISETVDDDKFKRDLIGFTVKTVTIAKYVLREIEDWESGEKKTSKDNKIINLEHIIPKNNSLWKVPDEFHKKNLYRLANQTLLLEEYNKSISNKVFDIKKNMYEKSELKITRDLCEYDKWDEAAIQDREQKLNNIIVKRWALLN